jgi:hypothetical protein
MYYDHHRLGSDESFDRSNATGHFEEALQELVYEGIASFMSTETDVEEGKYYVPLRDNTTLRATFDLTVPSGWGHEHAVVCEWVRYRGELPPPAGAVLDSGAGTWREAVQYLQSTAKAAHERVANPPGRS